MISYYIFSAKDVEHLTQLKMYQETLIKTVQDEKEAELKFEKNLGELFLIFKKILPTNIATIKSLKELETLVKMAKGTGQKTNVVDKYLQILAHLDSRLVDIETNVSNRLLQMHSACESEDQNEAKLQIRKICSEARNLLKPDNNLEIVVHAEWSKKILPRERGLYRGIISLVPLINDYMFQISSLLDDYISEFPPCK